MMNYKDSARMYFKFGGRIGYQKCISDILTSVELLCYTKPEAISREVIDLLKDHNKKSVKIDLKDCEYMLDEVFNKLEK